MFKIRRKLKEDILCTTCKKNRIHLYDCNGKKVQLHKLCIYCAEEHGRHVQLHLDDQLEEARDRIKELEAEITRLKSGG